MNFAAPHPSNVDVGFDPVEGQWFASDPADPANGGYYFHTEAEALAAWHTWTDELRSTP